MVSWKPSSRSDTSITPTGAAMRNNGCFSQRPANRATAITGVMLSGCGSKRQLAASASRESIRMVVVRIAKSSRKSARSIPKAAAIPNDTFGQSGAIRYNGATLPKRIVGYGRRLGYTAGTFSRGLGYAYDDHPDAFSAGTGCQLAFASTSGQHDPGDGRGPVCRPLAE